MSIIPKETLIKKLEEYFHIALQQVPKKHIFYSGFLSNKMRMLVCTPKTKLYPQGFGWVDITTVQLDLFKEFEYKILAVRMEGGKVYYLHMQDLLPYLTPEAMKYNDREGDHWKLYLYPDHIVVTGNKSHFFINPNQLNNL